MLRSLLVAALVAPLCALADSQLTLRPQQATVTVTPAVAAPDILRTITVNGVWPNGCPPGNPTIERDPLKTNTLVFKLFVPQTFVACTQALTNYEAKQTYMPREGGVEPIVVLTNDGQLLGEGQVITQSKGKEAHSTVNLTGEWHAAETLGSGLFLSHDFAGSDAILGAWFYYDVDGRARWGSVQLGTWLSPTVYTGPLLEFQAAPGNCVTVRACPRAAATSATVALVRIEVQNENTIIVEAHNTIAPTITPPLPPLFRSVMSRLQF